VPKELRKRAGSGWLAFLAMFWRRALVLAVHDGGAIGGAVTDPTKAVVPGATVTAKNTATGATATAVTDANGASR
jgi:hypothetical protein